MRRPLVNRMGTFIARSASLGLGVPLTAATLATAATVANAAGSTTSVVAPPGAEARGRSCQVFNPALVVPTSSSMSCVGGDTAFSAIGAVGAGESMSTFSTVG